MGAPGALRVWAIGALMASGLSCSRAAAPPPEPEALLVVDTDAPVPAFINRLRVDLYTPDAASWYASSDFALLDPSDWPASFAVYTPDEQNAHDVLVRLRAYPDGATRDYEGERFISRAPAGSPGDPATPAASADHGPRLTVGGADVTPAAEPQPYVTIDRLVLVHLQPGVVGKVVVRMSGACFGTMADLGDLLTCVDTDATLVPVTSSALDPDLSVPTPVEKTFGASSPCTGSPRAGTTLADGTRLYDDEACVPGGAYTFGNLTEFGEGDESGLPRHVYAVSPFTLDAYEVTVARWRDALSRGFHSPDATPTANAQPMARDTCTSEPPNDATWCAWSAEARVPEDREAFAVNCVSWAAARAFCKFEGGDLPSEVQWEYVAQVVGHAVKPSYPWGTEDPFCIGFGALYDYAIYARMSDCSAGGVGGHETCTSALIAFPQCDVASDPHGQACSGAPIAGCCGTDPREGPQRVDAVVTQPLPPAPDGGTLPLDVASVGGGQVVGLSGGVSEWMRDAFHGLDDQCWAATTLVDPVCEDSPSSAHAVRGGSWESVGYFILLSTRRGGGLTDDFGPQETGFRCMRPVTP